MFIAPCQKLLEVYKTKNYLLIPLLVAVMQILCSTTWTVYGLYLGDINIIMPNILGVILGLINFLTYFMLKS